MWEEDCGIRESLVVNELVLKDLLNLKGCLLVEFFFFKLG